LSRLDELAIGDLDVRASIATSYHLLTPAARLLLLRRLGVAATTDWPAWFAAELALRLSGFLAMRTNDAERDRVLRAAVAAARANGADRHLVRLPLSLFGLAAQRSAFTELPALAAEALALARKLGDRLAEVGALGNAGEAAARRRESRRILRDLGLADEALRLPGYLLPAGTAPGR
jgi:hypothetical protein